MLSGHLCRCTGYTPIIARRAGRGGARCGRRPMLDLGTSLLASVARDPRRARHRRMARCGSPTPSGTGSIAAVVAGLEAIGLRPGDHLLTLLQNRWEAATLHWACQLAGIIITPLNWRAKADEVEYCVADAEALARWPTRRRRPRRWPALAAPRPAAHHARRSRGRARRRSTPIVAAPAR